MAQLPLDIFNQQVYNVDIILLKDTLAPVPEKLELKTFSNQDDSSILLPINSSPPPPVQPSSPPLPGWVSTIYITQAGNRRGPYYVRKWKKKGKTHREYIKPQDLERVRAACKAHREIQARKRLKIREFNIGVDNFNFLCRMGIALDKGPIHFIHAAHIIRIHQQGITTLHRPKLRKLRPHGFRALAPCRKARGGKGWVRGFRGSQGSPAGIKTRFMVPLSRTKQHQPAIPTSSPSAYLQHLRAPRVNPQPASAYSETLSPQPPALSPKNIAPLSQILKQFQTNQKSNLKSEICNLKSLRPPKTLTPAQRQAEAEIDNHRAQWPYFNKP